MLGRKLLILLALSAFAFGNAALAADAQGEKTNAAKKAKSQSPGKTKKKSHRTTSRQIAHKLIPPPPAYMPSILPELYYQQNVGGQEEEEVEVAEAPDGKPKLIYVKNYTWGSNPSVHSTYSRSH